MFCGNRKGLSTPLNSGKTAASYSVLEKEILGAYILRKYGKNIRQRNNEQTGKVSCKVRKIFEDLNNKVSGDGNLKQLVAHYKI